MSLTESRLYRETLAAAMAFHARKLWLEYENDECAAVVVPGEEHPMLASIMGQGGEEFGLVLFRGPAAGRSLLRILERDVRENDAPDDAPFVGFSMDRYEEIPPPGRSFLAKAAFTGRGRDIAPSFFAKDANREPRRVTSDEVRKCLCALKGILKARDAGLLTPPAFDAGRDTLTLVLSGDPLDPEVKTEYRRIAVQPAVPVASLSNARADLKGLPRIPGRWLLGFPSLPVSIASDDRTVRLVLIVDEPSELILVGNPVQGGLSEAVDRVCQALRGENTQKQSGIPAEVLITSQDLFQAIAPVLDSLGARCRYEPRLPLLDSVLRDFIKHLGDGEAEPDDTDEDEEAVPAPEDLDGWKRCDASLYQRAQARIAEAAETPDRAFVQYFGSAKAASGSLNDPDDRLPSMAFFEWFWLDYRAPGRQRTLAERMLAEPLPEPQRILLEARLQATPSLFKVERIERGTSLTMLDVLFGGEVVLHDKSLSETARVDFVFPARIFPAGNYHFGSPLGPPLPAIDADRVLHFLEQQGLKLTREGTKEKPHLFGHLWSWAAELRASHGHLRMKNTDGDDLCFHTATYAVRDEAQARAALAAHQNVEQDTESGDYVWFRPNDPKTARIPGDTLTLGRLSFAGDELLLEVNSARRLKKARGWLDKVPGIEFKSVLTRTLEELREDGVPPDDRLDRKEVEMTPELAARVREMMHAHYMRWLDMPLPMFGRKTPREMCRTADGKKQVARYIRTIPKPVSSTGPEIEVPRKEMFDALGLSEDD
jgi:hypothetical protein